MEEAQTYNPVPKFPTDHRSKSNKKFIIPIIILSAAVIALSGYIAIPLLQKDTQNNPPNENPTSENSNENPNPEESNEDVTSENPTENTIPITSWNLSEASALTESDAAQIKALYDDSNVTFDTSQLVGQEGIYNSPIYPYQFIEVSSLPHHKTHPLALNAATYAYRTSPTTAWQEGFGTQSIISCDQEEWITPGNDDALKAFAAFECYTTNNDGYGTEIQLTIGAYNRLWKSSYSGKTATN